MPSAIASTIVQLPPVATPLPRTVVPSMSSTVSPGSASPLKVTDDTASCAFCAGVEIVGAFGGLVSMKMALAAGEASGLPAASRARTSKV